MLTAVILMESKNVKIAITVLGVSDSKIKNTTFTINKYQEKYLGNIGEKQRNKNEI